MSSACLFNTVNKLLKEGNGAGKSPSPTDFFDVNRYTIPKEPCPIPRKPNPRKRLQVRWVWFDSKIPWKCKQANPKIFQDFGLASARLLVKGRATNM